MKTAVPVGLLLGVIVTICEGLRCWHCLNQNSNLECLINGELKECLPSQKECQNEIRSISDNRYFKITKRCKQNIGCGNNRKQNALLANTYECEKRNTVNVCWCCCQGDNCNGPEVYCQAIQPKCDILTPPVNGVVNCYRQDGSIGTNCIYRCRYGYGIEGTSRVTCVRTGFGAIWSSSAPTCRQLFCDSVPFPPEHGSVSCSDRNTLYSTCDFSCNPDYFLLGASSTTCSHLGMWSDPSPQCVSVSCHFPRRIDKNLILDCTNDNKIGSVCRFICMDGFEIRGRLQMTCGEPVTNGFGRWSNGPAKCVRSGCPSLQDKRASNKVCTNGNSIGSVCTYSCNSGEYMLSANGVIVGNGIVETTCEAESGWTHDAPVCEQIKCPVLRTVTLNGRRTCTEGSSFGSECSYLCNSDYRVEGANRITCQQGNTPLTGRWSESEPICIASRCPVLQDDRVPNKLCTDENNIGSTCTYSCSFGDYMMSKTGAVIESGVVETTCEANAGWTQDAPVCEQIKCPVLQIATLNGRRTCTRGNNFGSECSYSCNTNYRVRGTKTITCQPGDTPGTGKWDNSEPTCVGGIEFGAGSCTNYGDVSDGEVTCSPTRWTNGSHWLEKAECSIYCNDYPLVSSLNTVKCSDGEWQGQLCCDRCLTDQELDVIVLMDMSFNDPDLRDVLLSFSSDFASYITEEYNLKLNFVVIPYATTVEEENIKFISDITFDNTEKLSEELPESSFVQNAAGDSNTGKALEYVNGVMLDTLSNRSVPLVIILTNKSPNDEDLAVTESQKLRDKRVHIRIVPFVDYYHSEAGDSQAIYKTLTGKEENSVVNVNSVEDFYKIATTGVQNYPSYCDIAETTC